MADTVPKKIKLNLNYEEEIELTDREEQIYEAGKTTGHNDASVIWGIVVIVLFLIYNVIGIILINKNG